MAGGSYTFGDSELAAERLALLAEVFAATTTRFLERLGPGPWGRVADLGCGPGFTSRLLADLLDPSELVAVDLSPDFAREAAARLGERGRVLAADVGELPEELGDLDLCFARLLLTHLPDPAAAIDHWLGRLSPGGSLALEEVDSIATDDPVFSAYLDLQKRMLAANHGRLEIGSLLERIAIGAGLVWDSEIAVLSPGPVPVARMFAMNFVGWRERAVEAGLAGPASLEAIAAGLGEISTGARSAGPITWRMRQMVMSRRPEIGG